MPDETQFPTLATPIGEADVATPDEIGGFRILSVLGRGGMGIVYDAEQETPHRRVALKVIRAGRHSDELHLRLFRREAETLARLVHPNIAAHLRGRPHRGRPALLHDGAGRRPAARRLRARPHGGRRAHTRAAARPAASLRDDLPGRQLRPPARSHPPRPEAVEHRRCTPAGDVKILDFGLARIADADSKATS